MDDRKNSFLSQLQLLMESQPGFPQRFKHDLELESNKMTNHFQFIGKLLSNGVLCDGSNESEATIGLKEMMAQVAAMIAYSKGADAISGLLEALDESGNSALASTVRAWTKEDSGIEPEKNLSDRNDSNVQTPTSTNELSSSGTKLIDKIMSRVEDDFMEQLEGHLLGKASQVVNVPKFCSSLGQQKVLDETDILQTAEPEVQGGQLTENLIKAACSKRAIGSLVLALQHSSNEDILAETYEWLATFSSARKRNHRMTTTSLGNKRSKEETPKTFKSIIFEQAAHPHELSKLVTLKCQQKSATKGTIGVQFDKKRMMACSADGTIDLWNWWDKEQDSIKIAANLKNITSFQYDEQILVLGTTDGTVHLFDARKFEEKCSINLNNKMVPCLKDQEVTLLKFVQSTVMVITRRGGYERLWSIDLSRRDMRLLNPRSLLWWVTIEKQTPDVFMLPDMSFVTYGTVVQVYHTKSGKQMTDSPEFPVFAPGVISTLHVGDLYSTKRVLMTGCVNGKIRVWRTSQGTWGNPFRTFQAHTEAVVSLCSLNGHLLSLDQSGKLLMWFGHNLDNITVAPAPRVVLESSNMTSLAAHQRWFASCSSKDDMINIWTMPDSWLRTY